MAVSPLKGIICLFYVKTGIAVGRYSPVGDHTVIKIIPHDCDGFYALPQQYQGTSAYGVVCEEMQDELCHVDVCSGVVTLLGPVPQFEDEDNWAVCDDKLFLCEPHPNIWKEACYRYIGSCHRMDASVCVCEGKMYAFGGENTGNGNLSDVVDCYDPETNSWASLHRMPWCLTSQGCVAVQHRIYAVGGRFSPYQYKYRAVDTLLCYDTHTDTWTELQPMPTPRFRPAVCVHGGRIYVMGGMNRRKKWLDVVESYDIQSNTWNSHAAMPWRFCRVWFGGVE